MVNSNLDCITGDYSIALFIKDAKAVVLSAYDWFICFVLHQPAPLGIFDVSLAVAVGNVNWAVTGRDCIDWSISSTFSLCCMCCG